MPYTQPFVLTTVEGNFGTAPILEQWRATWKIPISDADVPAAGEILGYLTAIAPAVSTWHTSEVNASVAAQLVSISGAVVGTDGRYLGAGAQETVRYTYPSTVGGLAGAVHPFDAALCISMHSTNARGRASRGRFYWPAAGLPLGPNDGLISTANQLVHIENAKTLLDAINGAAHTAFGPTSNIAVMSQLGLGTTATVQSVSVGRKLDHMSSRTGNQSEAHIWTDLESTRVVAQEALDAVHQRMREELASG